jgi:hypothetical protein
VRRLQSLSLRRALPLGGKRSDAVLGIRQSGQYVATLTWPNGAPCSDRFLTRSRPTSAGSSAHLLPQRASSNR